MVAARYKASDEQAEVGGDFYDAFQTDDGGAMVVIGDVQGHSLEAAVVMAELRYSVRAYAYDGSPLGQVLSRVNAVLMRGHLEMTATLCMLMFPPDRQTMVVANAGHLPPLIVHDGVASYLEHGGPLLGVDHPGRVDGDAAADRRPDPADDRRSRGATRRGHDGGDGPAGA